MNKIVKNVLVGVTLVGMVASIFIGKTFSKYINKVSGDGETQVAKWSFKVNDETEEFATIKLTDTYDKTTLTNGKIAPGTKGHFDLVIDATDAEVGVKYEIDFQNETNKPTNLIYKLDNKTVSTIEELEDSLTGIINVDDTSKIRTLKVEWEWPYETGTTELINSNDEIDTKEGLEALDYTFDIVVTGTQVIPIK